MRCVLFNFTEYNIVRDGESVNSGAVLFQDFMINNKFWHSLFG